MIVGGLVLVVAHVTVLLRKPQEPKPAFAVLLPTMFILFSRADVENVRLGMWAGLGGFAMFLLVCAVARILQGPHRGRLVGTAISMGECALLAAMCGWTLWQAPLT